MVVDYYPDEEGYISEGHIIGYAKAGTAITAFNSVKLGTTAAGSVVVDVGAADGDSIGIALKTAVTNDLLPVALRGIMKIVAGEAIAANSVLKNDSSPGYMLVIGDLATGTAAPIFVGLNGTGTVIRMGIALQDATQSGDEILMLLGAF